MPVRRKKTRTLTTAMEGQALLINRMDVLKNTLDTVMETSQRADARAREAMKRMETWESTLRDHSKTVGLMDAWRKELERRIEEVSSRIAVPTSPFPTLTPEQRMHVAVQEFLKTLTTIDPTLMR